MRPVILERARLNNLVCLTVIGGGLGTFLVFPNHAVMLHDVAEVLVAGTPEEFGPLLQPRSNQSLL